MNVNVTLAVIAAVALTNKQTLTANAQGSEFSEQGITSVLSNQKKEEYAAYPTTCPPGFVATMSAELNPETIATTRGLIVFPLDSGCKPFTPCPAGWFTAAGFDTQETLVCKPCRHGFFKDAASQDSGEQAGMTEFPAAACKPRSFCPPGTYTKTAVDESRTKNFEPECTACPTGQWKSSNPPAYDKEALNELQHRRCQDHYNCPPGSYITYGGDSVKDRACGTCPSGKYTDEFNSVSCTLQTACPDGTSLMVQPEVSLPRDEDVNITRDCEAIMPCPAGTFTATLGTSVYDAECAPCPDDTYRPNASLSINGTETGCPEPHRAPCEAGTYTSTVATTVSPSACTPCPSGTYKSAASDTIFELEQAETSCTQQPVCGPGEYTSPTQPQDDKTALQNPECTACAAGTFKPGSSANAWGVVAAQSVSTSEICMPHTPCPSGMYTSKAGSATEEPTCTICPPGSFKPFASASTTETDTCQTWVRKPGCCRTVLNEINVNGDSVDVVSAADADTVSAETFPPMPGAEAEIECGTTCENEETCTAVEVVLTSDKAAAKCEFHTGSVNAATRAGNACKKNFCMIKTFLPAAANEIDVNKWNAKSGCCREDSELGKFTHNENTIVVNILLPNSVSDAVVACKQECNAMEGCTAVEVRRVSKAKTPYFKCELHTADINSATRSSKSCKQAKCEIKK